MKKLFFSTISTFIPFFIPFFAHFLGLFEASVVKLRFHGIQFLAVARLLERQKLELGESLN